MPKTVRVCHDGLDLCLGCWSRRCGVPARLLAERLRNGWPFARAISRRPLRHLGAADLRELAREYAALPRGPAGKVLPGEVKRLARVWKIKPDAVRKIALREGATP